MATATLLTSAQLGFNQASATTLATASITPDANCLLVAFAHALKDGNPGTTDMHSTATMVSSGSGPTWSKLTAAAPGGSFFMHGAIWTATIGGTDPGSFTVTADWSGTAKGWALVNIYKVTDYNTGTPTGGKVTNSTATGDGAVTVTLDAAPASGDITLASNSADCTAGGGAEFNTTAGTWTEDAQGTGTPQLAWNVGQRTGSTSTSVPWSDVNGGTGNFSSSQLAVVVKAASAPTLTVADASHEHTSDAVALTQVHNLTVADAAHDHTTENVTLTFGVTLTVADTSHAHSADTAVLTQVHVLVVSDTSHAHTSANVLFVVGFWPTTRSGRLILDQNGNPWQIHGDAGWSAITITVAEQETYLDGILAQSHNAFFCNLVEDVWNTNTPTGANSDGVSPFTGTWFQTGLTDSYWDRVESFVAAARDRGLTIIADLAYCGFNDSQGVGELMTAATNTQMGDYGAAVATRLLAYPNVIWMIGGDRLFTSGSTLGARYNAMVEGIRSVDINRLMLGHTDRDDTAISQFGTGYTSAWLDWNSVYTYLDTAIDLGDAAWDETPALPLVMLEGPYANETTGDAADIRRNLWAGCLWGGGHISGHNELWNFEQNPIFAGDTWLSCLTNPEMDWCGVAYAFFDTIEWGDTSPDFTTQLVTTGQGTGASRAGVALGGELAVVYFPNSRAITCDLTVFTAPIVRARWLDPTTGSFTAINSYLTTGPQTFTHPGNNAAGGTDQVLVLDYPALEVAGAAHGHTSGAVVLTQAHNLSVDDTAHSHMADAVALTQVHNLTAADSAHAHSAENVAITQVHSLVAADSEHAHTTDPIVLTQVHNLAVADSAHAHITDNLTLTAEGDLVVQDSSHAHASDSPTLTQTHNLVVQESAHASTTDNLSLTQSHALAVADSSHGHTSDAIVLTQTHNLTLTDTSHAHTTENVTLTVGGTTLAVADSAHSHTTAGLAVTQVHALLIADTAHAHTSDILVLSGPGLGGYRQIKGFDRNRTIRTRDQRRAALGLGERRI